MPTHPGPAPDALDAFVSHFSHEVRSPLHAITGFAELLSDDAFGKMSPEQAVVVADIHSAASHLLALFNDVLDVSRLQMGRLVCRADTLCVPTLLRIAVDAAQPAARERGIALLPPASPDLAARGDERRVLQALGCLLLNSIAYSPAGQSVEVTAAAGEGAVWIAVRDHGYGIAHEDRERIFEPFVGVRCGDAEPGPGLGLTLARGLVQVMGGEMLFDTGEDGSTFRFSLPAALPSDE